MLKQMRQFKASFVGVESVLTDLVAEVGPWLSQVPTAYLVGRATLTHLSWPWPVAVIAAVVIEILGLSAIHTFTELREYNATRRKSDSQAPEGLALVLVGGYFVVAVTLTVFLDIVPDLAMISPAIFPVLGLCGVSVLALRRDHWRRLEAIAEDKARRSGSRSKSGHDGGQVNDQNRGSLTEADQAVEVSLAKANAARRSSRQQALDALIEFYRSNPGASYREASRSVRRSKSWVVSAVDTLQSAGRLTKDGQGVEVLP